MMQMPCARAVHIPQRVVDGAQVRRPFGEVRYTSSRTFSRTSAAELWSRMGYDSDVHSAPWPRSEDESAAADSGAVSVTVAVGGRARLTLSVPSHIADGAAPLEAFVRAHPDVDSLIAHKKFERVIVVPKRRHNAAATVNFI